MFFPSSQWWARRDSWLPIKIDGKGPTFYEAPTGSMQYASVDGQTRTPKRGLTCNLFMIFLTTKIGYSDTKSQTGHRK